MRNEDHDQARSEASGDAVHTPGPWRLFIGTNASFTVAADGKEIVSRGPMRDHGETLANARLIAAAPDLLAALSEVLPYMPVRVEYQRAIHARACAAIRKAGGELG